MLALRTRNSGVQQTTLVAIAACNWSRRMVAPHNQSHSHFHLLENHRQFAFLMHRNHLNIEFIDTGQKPRTLAWRLKDIDHVEQLIYSILEDKGVGPVYWQLFGIRLARAPNIWLAPNIKTRTLLQSHLGTSPGTLELRMRYRASSYTKLSLFDKKAFDIVFAQIRYDFLNSKLSTTAKKKITLFNESVLGLIVYDLIRHAIENNINDEDIFKRVNLKKFIPLKAPKWQRLLLYHLREKLNLPKSIQVGLRSCNRNVSKVKQAFIELFLHEVCPDYGAEVYRVICLENPAHPIETDIRVRYVQTSKDSSCVVEDCLATQDSIRKWVELCDIYTICYGALRGETVEIDRTCGSLLRLRFGSSLEAHSFTSLIDGYYRLMKKWNFNFCRDVISPDLEFLKKMRCHGPIGLESMRLKLNKSKKPGSFIIRRCMKLHNRFIIDAILQSKVRLSIDIQWDRDKGVYSVVSHSTKNNRGMNVEIYLNHVDYKDLNAMINDIQIKVDDPAEIRHPPQQLKHWIPPSEHDDCPALLLSISKSRMGNFDKGSCNSSYSCRSCPSLDSYKEMPRIIPISMIRSHVETIQGFPNMLTVRAASLNGEHSVIVKAHMDEEQGAKTDINQGHLVIYQDSGSMRKKDFITQLKPAQLRLADWIFVKSEFIAETIGLELTKNALIQELLPFGSLSQYLSSNGETPTKIYASIIHQLASTLLFLQEIAFMHGKLRCHNFLIKCLDPLRIKLTDPLGTINLERDRAFIPPVYLRQHSRNRFDANDRLCFKEYEPDLDVWAFGTTLWQVYSQGRWPSTSSSAMVLAQPKGCPDKIWQIISHCWAVVPTNRPSAQKLFRDLNDEFAWQIYKDDYEYAPSGSYPGGDIDSTKSSFMSSAAFDAKIDSSQIRLISEIGRGNNGIVFKGVLTHEENSEERLVAVKRLIKHHEATIHTYELKREYDMLKNLDHENIVKTLGLINDGNSTMLVMEFVPLGSLHTRLKSLPQNEVFNLPLHKYACDIAKGMEYLESMKVVHRDLALRNILVSDDDEVKICDFGLARTLDCSNCYKLQTDRPLPVKWYAPEVLTSWIFTHKSDIWSFGIVLWEIYSGGDVPQYSGTYSNLMNTLKHERLLIPKDCPMQMYALMLRCWALEPQDRGNFTQIRERLENMVIEGESRS